MNAITLEVEQLAQYIFVKNTHNNQIGLDIHGLGSSKDLFCFCLDLFCKGIVLTLGMRRGDGDADDNEGGGECRRAEIDDMSMADFEYMSRKLQLAGIKCLLQLDPLDAPLTPEQSKDVLHWSILNVQRMPDNLLIQQYSFTIKLQEALCTVRFEILPAL